MYNPVLVIETPVTIPIIHAHIHQSFLGYETARIELPIKYAKFDRENGTVSIGAWEEIEEAEIVDEARD